MPEQNPILGAFIAIQTCGNFLGFNPSRHVLVADGCFLRQAQDSVYGRGLFRLAPALERKKLEVKYCTKVQLTKDRGNYNLTVDPSPLAGKPGLL